MRSSSSSSNNSSPPSPSKPHLLVAFVAVGTLLMIAVPPPAGFFFGLFPGAAADATVSADEPELADGESRFAKDEVFFVWPFGYKLHRSYLTYML